MKRAFRCFAALLGVLPAALASRPVLAQSSDPKPVPAYVLSIWTEDADDEADALTQALRARTRQSGDFTLLDSTQSFETLAIALKCPPKPDPSCLLRIGDQLKTDRYFWGTMQKKGASREVSAEVHLWVRGKPEVVVRETYAGDMKDPGDESLRSIAGAIFGKLVGTATSTLIVRAGTAGGTVTVDGVDKGVLSGGIAWIDVPPGSHTIGVRVPGLEAPSQITRATLGSEQIVAFTLSPVQAQEAEPPAAAEPDRRSPSHTVLGYSTLVLGAGFLVAAGIEAAAWSSDNNANTNDRRSVPKSITDVCADPANNAAIDACSKSRDAVTVSTLGWIFAGAGAVLAGAGIWLIASDSSSKEAPRDAPASARAEPKLELLPAVGVRESSVTVRVRF